MIAVKKTSASSSRPTRVARWRLPDVRRALVAAILLAGLFVPMTPAPAASQAPESQALESRLRALGRETFRTHCATCHGVAARGDGPLAPSMRQRPTDLAELARRNGGQFPSDLVYRTIDGRQPIRGHGGPDMPVWGDAFLKSRYCGDATALKETLDSLVKFLESIQLRNAH